MAYWNIDIPDDVTDRSVSSPTNLQLEDGDESI